MNALMIDRIARAVLYEGYLLYPYRLSAVKNRQRWNFGVLYPPAYAEKFGPNESSWMQTECLIEGDPLARLRVRVRFLHLIPQGEQEAVEREVVLPECRLIEIAAAELRHPFTFTEPPAQSIEGFVELSAVTLEDDLFRITARVVNSTPVEQAADREAALRASMLSTHTILNGSGGAFVSLLETPEPFREAAAGCRNVGTWPVLAGEPGCRD